MTFVAMAKIHIGKKIKEVWKSSRLKGTEFAAMINKDRQVIYDIFDRETIDTGLLLNISKVLNHDFFSYYSQQNQVSQVKEAPADYGYATKDDLQTLTNTVETLARVIEKMREDLPKKKAAPKKKYAKKQP